MMKINKWTLGLAAVGLVSIPSALQAEEKLSPLQTALSSTVISGYISTSMHWSPGSQRLPIGAPPAYAFNTPAKQDGFNVNVVDITIEKPLDEGTWSAGYKVELWFGPDAVGFNTANPATAAPAGPGGPVGVGGDLALKQAYVALRVPVGNGLDLKVGTFDTIIGYEVANAGSNPNYTRSYGYTIEPTQHTGVLASYQVNKAIGLTAGVANTHNSGLSTRGVGPGGLVNESFKTYMGAVTLTAPDSFGSFAGSALYLGVVNGPNTSVAAPGPSVTLSSYYVGATLNTPVKGLKAGISYDYGYAPGIPAAGLSAQSLALYLSYQATEKLSLHGRAEYFVIGTGVPVGALPAGLPSEALAFTGTIQYNLWANVMSRLEVRWDHSTAGAAGLPKPFDFADKNSFLVAANIIYKF